MSRKEFPISVKREALKRSGGFCEVHLMSADIKDRFPDACDQVAKELDHVRACGLEGGATLENAAYLCREHHLEKTRSDQEYMSKNRRFEVNRDRPKKNNPKQKMKSRPFNKEFKKKFDGTVERKMK
ncbi:MAG: hypothetical protein JKY52_08385 [Flavobacteriales bacterium]|nr:hypothetical protein [Flavobacteriales bacterium]